MSRAHAFVAIVLWVAFWPLAHRALVVESGGDPWRLGGFAMYATYQSTQVALFRVEPGGLRRVDDAKLPREAALAFRDYRQRRSALGRLASPDAALRAVHEARPDLRHLVLVVQRLWLDPETARIASEKEIHAYLDGRPVDDAPSALPPDAGLPGR